MNPIAVAVSSVQSTYLSSSVIELESVDECGLPHQHLCRVEGERTGEQ